MSRSIRELARRIRDLDEKDGFRARSTAQLLEKLYVLHCSSVSTQRGWISFLKQQLPQEHRSSSGVERIKH